MAALAHAEHSAAGRRALLTLAAGVGAAALPGCAWWAGLMASDPAAVTARLKAQADAWDRAIVRKDRAAIEANMADDFRQVDAAGNVENKAAFVDDIMSPALEMDPYTVEELDVRVFGEIALLSGRIQITGRFKGKPFTSRYRYIDIYVRRAGAWKLLSVQQSGIPG